MTTESERVKENLHHWIDHHSNRADKAEQLIDLLVEDLRKILDDHKPYGSPQIARAKKARETLKLADKWRNR